MSGFEVAGIVLGSLPLLISAIEHYESNLDRATAFFKWKDELSTALRKLWYQRSLFEMTLRNILKDTTNNGAEIEEMIADPRHELWKSPKLTQSLKNRLQSAYNPYILTVAEMESCMKRLVGHLNVKRHTGTANELEAIVKANQPISSSDDSLKFEFKRAIKFTMKRKQVRLLLADITDCNQRLDQFISKAETLNQHTGTHDASSKSVLSSSLQQIQTYAATLHQALNFAWFCSTHASHEVRLLLEHRMIWKQKQRSLRRTKQDSEPASFIISHKPSSAPKRWQIAEIEVTDECAEESYNTKEVKIEAPRGWEQQPRHVSLTVVNNLCSSSFRPNSIIPCLGFRLDPKGVLHGTYQVQRKPVCCADNLISLEDFLFTRTETDTWKPLTEEDRYILSITIASSFLQLHSTPWISGCWSRRNIRFSVADVGNQHVIDVRHPFVTEAYESSQHGLGKIQEANICFEDDSANLCTLAKLLLEIKFHGRQEFSRLKDDLEQSPEPDQVTKFQILDQWVRQQEGNICHAQKEAIRFCISRSNDVNMNLGDLQFRQTMLDNVVVPLMSELRNFQGKS